MVSHFFMYYLVLKICHKDRKEIYYIREGYSFRLPDHLSMITALKKRICNSTSNIHNENDNNYEKNINHSNNTKSIEHTFCNLSGYLHCIQQFLLISIAPLVQWYNLSFFFCCELSKVIYYLNKLMLILILPCLFPILSSVDL